MQLKIKSYKFKCGHDAKMDVHTLRCYGNPKTHLCPPCESKIATLRSDVELDEIYHVVISHQLAQIQKLVDLWFDGADETSGVLDPKYLHEAMDRLLNLQNIIVTIPGVRK